MKKIKIALVLALASLSQSNRCQPLANNVEFIHHNNMDIIAKYIYAKNKRLKVESNWPIDLYLESLCATGKLTTEELKNNKKKGFLYADKFDDLLTSLKNNKFSNWQNLIDKNTDESSLLAAFLAYNKKLPKNIILKNNQFNNITLDFFKNNNNHKLNESFTDALALQYCELKKNTFVSILFPCVPDKYEVIKKIFEHFGTIVYTKNIDLSPRGAFNLIRVAYEKATTMGSYEDNFAGARDNVLKRFTYQSKPGYYQIKAILFECKNLKTVRECKKTIREIFDYGPYPIHINDTHLEALVLARTLFHKNSIDFLNTAQLKNFANFNNYINCYQKFLTEKKLNPHAFCIDGSSIMAAHGLRDCGDIDLLHHGYDYLTKQLKKHPIIHSHNLDTLKHHPHSKDEIIFNPEHYFYYKNLKFATLQELKTTKMHRNSAKDLDDIKMIDQYLTQNAFPS